MKSVLITGGNKGIGLDITKCFLNKGYRVFIAARQYTDELKSLGNTIKFIPTDVRNYSEVESAVSHVVNSTGVLSCLVNNAGISEWKSIKDIDDAFFEKLINTNLKGYFWGCKAASQVMSNGASIINISSIAGKRGTANNSMYCATKFAVNGLTQALAKELGSRNIRVNALCPVLIATEGLMQALTAKDAPAFNADPLEFINNFTNSNSALQRMPTGKEVGEMCTFLASESASAITGQCINVDCGVLPQ